MTTTIKPFNIDDIRFVNNGEAIDEAVLNRPYEDLAEQLDTQYSDDMMWSLVLDYTRNYHRIYELPYGHTLKQFGDIHSFTRASDATMFDISGKLKTIGNDIPAIEYDPLVKENKGLRVAEQRTNIATRNKADANALATWTKANVTVATVADPQFGNVIELTDNATAAVHRVTLDFTTSDSVVRVRSVYVKAPASNAIPYAVISSRISVDNNDFNLVINLSTGAYTSTGSEITPTSVKPLGGGWYRIGLHVAQTNVNTRAFTIGMSESPLGTSTSYAGTGKKLLIALPQWETGTFATPPIETEAASVTRAVDVCTIDDLSPWFNPSEGTFVVEFEKPAGYSAATVQTVLQLDNGSNSDRLRLYCLSGGVLVRSETGGVGVTNNLGNPSGNAVKVAFAINGSTLRSSVNGGAVSSQAITANPIGLDNAKIGFGLGSSLYLNGSINFIKCTPYAVSDEKLQQLSTL